MASFCHTITSNPPYICSSICTEVPKHSPERSYTVVPTMQPSPDSHSHTQKHSHISLNKNRPTQHDRPSQPSLSLATLPPRSTAVGLLSHKQVRSMDEAQPQHKHPWSRTPASPHHFRRLETQQPSNCCTLGLFTNELL